MNSKIELVNPETHNALIPQNDILYDAITGIEVAKIENGIPRFVKPSENYAESFGWQWKQWADNQSESRGSSVKQRDLILERTHFLDYNLCDKTILECGMGGGDDTEVLLTLPFKEIHSFDLSTAVERAKQYLSNERLIISQASIYSIPYLDEAFDFVFCHRVLQHTPDPEKSLRSICKKVKKNGILFVHSYKRSEEYMSEWRYKYRSMTTRLPKLLVYYYVEYLGWMMHHLVELLYRLGPNFGKIAYRYVPFYRVNRLDRYYPMGKQEAIELEKMITFDALTPKYDTPMATDHLKEILVQEGFIIEHLEDSLITPVYATARKIIFN
jgi:ubiquinone/menaquinone biosynthesis C-methylase UbiE